MAIVGGDDNLESDLVPNKRKTKKSKKQEVAKPFDGLDPKFVKDHQKMLSTGSFIMEREIATFPFSPILDGGLGGGIPEGSWVILSGPEKCGKTLSGLHLMKKYQQAGRLCFYINIEGRIKRRDLAGIQGLDPDKVHMVQSTEGNILSGEEFLNTTANIINAHPGAYVLMDSTSVLCSGTELTEEIKLSMDTRPRLMASFTRKLATVVPIQRVTLVLVQHLISNIGGYGGPYEDGGKKVKYQGDVHLRCTSSPSWTNSDGVEIGKIAKWQVRYSALGPPGAKVESYIRYGVGIDEVMENIIIATDLGIISQGGAWFTIDFGDEPFKVQGQEKVHRHFVDNPDQYLLLQAKIKEMLS